jgi:hypothetical protein
MNYNSNMAFSTKIIGWSKETGKALYIKEGIPEWDYRILMDDERFKSQINSGYLDYSARLSIAEIRELNLQFTPDKDSLFKTHKHFRKELKDFNDILLTAHLYFSDFTVRVFEWESGLN